MPDEPDLMAELDAAEDVMMGRAIPEWWVLLPGAPWGGQTAILGPYNDEGKARAQMTRTRALGGGLVPEPKLLRTVPEDPGHDR